MGESDLGFTAELHAAALPHGFFVELGHRFLHAYHRTFLCSPYAVGLVAELDGAPVGMLVGTVDDTGHHRWVIRRLGPALAWRGVAALVVRPRLLLRFCRTRIRRYALGIARRLLPLPAPAHSPRPTSGRGVLTHVAVTADARGSGAGAGLVERFVADAAAAGASERVLVTLADDGAAAFYERLGWRREDQGVERDGRWYERCSIALR